MTRSEYKTARRTLRAFSKTPEGQWRRVENRSASSPAFVWIGPDACPALAGLSDREVEAVRARPICPEDLIPNRFAGWRAGLAHLSAKRQRDAFLRNYASAMVDFAIASAVSPPPVSHTPLPAALSSNERIAA